MKNLFCAGLLLMIFVFARCSMQRMIDRDVAALGKYAPDAFPAGNEEELKKNCYRGYALYKATCTGAGCHGVTNRGNDTIPFFNLVQLDNYESAAKKHDPKNHAVTAKLSPEQLKDILSFLFLRTLARQVTAQQAAKPEQKQ